MSDGAVKPRMGAAAPASTKGGTPTRTAPTQEPLRTGRPTSTPAQ
jgi:hypothetical protein